MPCKRSSLSSAIKSRIAALLIGRTELVISGRVGNGSHLEWQAGYRNTAPNCLIYPDLILPGAAARTEMPPPFTTFRQEVN